jgi:hypothetical protein
MGMQYEEFWTIGSMKFLELVKWAALTRHLRCARTRNRLLYS